MRRLSTGIPQLDIIMGGGLPVGSLIVVAGAPGTGKTILAQQICFSNASSEHRAVYYSTISEPPDKFISHLEVFGLLRSKRPSGRRSNSSISGTGCKRIREMGLAVMMDEIRRKCIEEHPRVVVVDSAKALRDYSGGDRSLRSKIYQLAGRLAYTDTTLIFVGEYSSDEIRSAPEFSLADGTLELVYASHEPMDRRWLRVRKLRSSKHLSGQHPLNTSGAGISVFVRAETVGDGDWSQSRRVGFRSGCPN